MRGELLLCVGRIRAVWPTLAAAAVYGGQRTVAERATPERLAYLDERARADRATRFVVLRDGTVPTGTMRAPGDIEATDVRFEVDRAVVEAASTAVQVCRARAIRSRAYTVDDRVADGLRILATVAGELPAAVAGPMVDDLATVATLAERVCGLEPAWSPIRQDCPACELPTLRVRQDSTDPGEWVVECRSPACRCRAIACPCGLLVREPGRRHVWSRDEWSTLAAVLTQ